MRQLWAGRHGRTLTTGLQAARSELPRFGLAAPAAPACHSARWFHCRCHRRRTAAPTASLPQEREHQRILAAYGGVYDDPRLQAMIEQTVERLVAASERPDQNYKVTMLNSPAVNAFALPTGQTLCDARPDRARQRQVRACLGARPRDGPRHRAPRRASARSRRASADLVSRVVTDVV